jgi:lipoate-protein ligase A
MIVSAPVIKAYRIPGFRQKVGGGAVFLDGRRLFFHLILKRDDPIDPLDNSEPPEA